MANYVTKKRRDALLLVITTVVLLSYFLLNRSIGSIHVLTIPLDAKVPLIPIFVIPYLLTLPTFYLTVVYAYWSKKGFAVFASSIIITWLICFAFYIFYQTHVLRPEVIGNGFAENLVRFIYSQDQPYNCFPSTHVAMATLMLLYFNHIKSRWTPLVLIFSSLVIVSTVFIKQHYLLDVASGIALSYAVYWLTNRYLAARK